MVGLAISTFWFCRNRRFWRKTSALNVECCRKHIIRYYMVLFLESPLGAPDFIQPVKGRVVRPLDPERSRPSGGPVSIRPW